MKIITKKSLKITDEFPTLEQCLQLIDENQSIGNVNPLQTPVMGCSHYVVEQTREHLSKYATNYIVMKILFGKFNTDTIYITYNKNAKKCVIVCPVSAIEWLVVTIDLVNRRLMNLGSKNGAYVVFIMSDGPKLIESTPNMSNSHYGTPWNSRYRQYPKTVRILNLRVDNTTGEHIEGITGEHIEGTLCGVGIKFTFPIEESDNSLIVKFHKYQFPVAAQCLNADNVSVKLHNPHVSNMKWVSLNNELFNDAAINLDKSRPIDTFTEMALLNR